MAIIKRNELKQMGKENLKNKLVELRKELIKVNAQISTGTPPENPGRVREIKKTIARILTILNQPKQEVKEKSKKQTEETKKQ
jgi:large subunit ribosomal protein L29